MDVLTDTEMSDRCTDALPKSHDIWGTDGGIRWTYWCMEYVLWGHTDIQGDV